MLIATFVLLCVSIVHCDCSTPMDLSKSSPDSVVKLLASKNSSPTILGDGLDKPILPVGYDKKAQDLVYAAWEELLRRDSNCIPELVDHLDDESYSVTEDSGTSWGNHSVRWVVLQILTSQIEPYRSELPDGFRQSPPPSYVRENLAFKDQAKAWLEKHKSSRLVDVQLEAAKWALETCRDKHAKGLIKDSNFSRLERYIESLDRHKTYVRPSPHIPKSRM